MHPIMDPNLSRDQSRIFRNECRSTAGFNLAGWSGLPMLAAQMLSDPPVYALALLAAFCIGLSKSGFSGMSMVSVVLLADIYGSKASVGLALPLLIAADMMAYPAFLKHGSWRPVWRLLGPALTGIFAGWWLLGMISETTARQVIGGCVLSMVALQVARRCQPACFDRLVDSRGFGASAGLLGGFATMLANAAGPVIQLYLMARKIPKMELIGIGARFFLLINLLKVPLNARLALITPDSLMENLRLVPAVAIGIFGGKWLLHRVPQSVFEWMVVIFATCAGLRMVLW
jgi:uncharacterized membrane protein YfcA